MDSPCVKQRGIAGQMVGLPNQRAFVSLHALSAQVAFRAFDGPCSGNGCGDLDRLPNRFGQPGRAERNHNSCVNYLRRELLCGGT